LVSLVRIPHKIFVEISLLPLCHMPRPSHRPYWTTHACLGEEYKPRSPSVYSCLRPIVTSSLLDQNIPLSTLLSNTLSLCSSLYERQPVSHPYKQQEKYSFFPIDTRLSKRKHGNQTAVLALPATSHPSTSTLSQR